MEVLSKGLKEVAKGLLIFVSCSIGYMGYYPVFPAYFAVCCMEGKTPFTVVIGAIAGVLCFMTLESVMKYFFAIVVIWLGIHFFLWMNRSCDSMAAAMIAGAAVIAMNFAGTSQWSENGNELLVGICEGVMVFGVCVVIHGLFGVSFRFDYFLKKNQRVQPVKRMIFRGAQLHRMESLAYAVGGLSDVFFALSYPKSKQEPEEMLSEEACESCDRRALCWKENHGQELKNAWNKRLMENRYIIAQQLDAMSDLMQEWTKFKINVDSRYTRQLAAATYGIKEKGLLAEELHVYEEKDRICVEGYISAGWNSGIPLKHYIHAVEKAFGTDMRAGREAKNILNGESIFISLYEDTKFYALQGVVTEKKDGSPANGDSYSFFSMDDGNYHVCLSDGMGSGNKAKEESEMVLELLQKFIEAGFRKETAIQLMNSAMVLQGEENSFSTLDYAVIDMYTGELDLVKIGGAATFIKHGREVECMDFGTLPAGADARMEIESVKRTLRNGDFLVMVTDGVIEYLHVRSPKETLMDIIAMAETENAGAMAEHIMTRVMVLTGGFPKDDMTVLVTGIWEK